MNNEIYNVRYHIPHYKGAAKANTSLAERSEDISGGIIILPSEPTLHKYGLKSDAFIGAKAVWSGDLPDTEFSRNLRRKFNGLPILSAYMKHLCDEEGYFFDLCFEKGLRVTISQYFTPQNNEGNDNSLDGDRRLNCELEDGAYVNVALNGEVLIQDYLAFDDIILAIHNFYEGIGYGQ